MSIDGNIDIPMTLAPVERDMSGRKEHDDLHEIRNCIWKSVQLHCNSVLTMSTISNTKQVLISSTTEPDLGTVPESHDCHQLPTCATIITTIKKYLHINIKYFVCATKIRRSF